MVQYRVCILWRHLWGLLSPHPTGLSLPLFNECALVHWLSKWGTSGASREHKRTGYFYSNSILQPFNDKMRNVFDHRFNTIPKNKLTDGGPVTTGKRPNIDLTII